MRHHGQPLVRRRGAAATGTFFPEDALPFFRELCDLRQCEALIAAHERRRAMRLTPSCARASTSSGSSRPCPAQ